MGSRGAHLLPLLKKKKIRAFAEFSLTGCFASEFLPRVTEAKSWLERQPDGIPIAHSNDNCLQLNVQHDGWRQYLAHKVRMAAGAGFDGFFFSDVVCKPADGGDFLTFLTDAVRTGRIPEIDEFAFYTSSIEQHIVAATNLKWLPCAARQIPDERHFGANIPLLKALFEVGGRDRTLFCGIPEQSTEKEARICAAEILASGGACHGLRAPANYQTFCASHNDIFGGIRSGQRTLAFSPTTESGAFSRLKADAALFERLLGRAIQFDVIPLSAVDSFDLKKYRVLSALHLEQVPEELGAKLAAFYKNGGAVLYPARPPEDAGVPPPPRTETTEGKGYRDSLRRAAERRHPEAAPGRPERAARSAIDRRGRRDPRRCAAVGQGHAALGPRDQLRHKKFRCNDHTARLRRPQAERSVARRAATSTERPGNRECEREVHL